MPDVDTKRVEADWEMATNPDAYGGVTGGESAESAYESVPKS
jgi:hypothetical protein